VLAGTARIIADAAPDFLASERAVQGMHAIEFRSGPLTIYAVGDAPPGASYAVIRAEEVVLSLEPHPSSARNHFRGTVSEVATLGALTRVVVLVGDVPLVAALTTRSAQELSLVEGRAVHATFKAMAVHLC
jgi:molybdopterin-binding protein